MEIEISLTDDDNLVYKFDSEKLLIKDFFLLNIYNIELISKKVGNNYSINLSKGLIEYKYNSFSFDTFMFGIDYNLVDLKKSGTIYSFTNLEKLLEKYKYQNPVYYSKNSADIKPLNDIRNIDQFQFLSEINIYDKEVDDNQLDNIYKELTKIYNIDVTKKQTIKIKELSPNFKSYFMKQNFNLDLEINNIYIYLSSKRTQIIYNLIRFINEKTIVKKNDENKIDEKKEIGKKIYALCGPFGIGKSFTALLLQKYLFYEKYPVLYINLALSENINDLKMIIIKELFFLIFDKQKYISESKIILNTVVNSLWEIIILIDDYCDKNKIEYLLILDQYQQVVDKKRLLDTIKAKKIFLLSSINDTDVKKNLVTQIKNETIPDINYIYLVSLFLMDEKKVKEMLKIEDKNIISILKYFNFRPISLFQLQYIYKMKILDFINYQFRLILKNLSKFYNNLNTNNIDYLNSNELINRQDTIIKNSIDIKSFLDNIDNITLKYIIYELYNKNSVNLSYAFNYVQYPLKCFLDYINSFIKFKSENNKSLKGDEFEKIIEYKFILDYPLFEIDSFLKVNEIVKMQLINEYQYIKNEEIKDKNCIFISQENQGGEDYDFAILKPKINTLILLQAKYKISSANINKKSDYSNKKKTKHIKDVIEKQFQISIEKIYLLYISSCEFNNSPDKTFKTLATNRINCIFYDMTNDYFTLDFKTILNKIELNSSFEIYPNDRDYTEYTYIKLRRIEQMTSSYIKEEQYNYVKSLDKSNEVKENNFLKEEHESFLELLDLCNFPKNITKHLGCFLYEYKNNYLFFPRIFYDYYLVFFNITTNNKKSIIDKTKEIILIYEQTNKLFYYVIKGNKFRKIESKDFKNKSKSLYYTIGYWKNDKVIDLKE